jgi:hypothetical protein
MQSAFIQAGLQKTTELTLEKTSGREQHRNGFYIRYIPNSLLDLDQIDSVASYLHLVISAAEAEDISTAYDLS